MACRTPLRTTAEEDWSNDDDFDFDDQAESSGPRIPSSLSKPNLNITSCDGRTVRMLSANANRSAHPPSRNTYGHVGEESADGIMGSSSSGSVATAKSRYADMADLDMMDGEDVEYPTIKGLESQRTSSAVTSRYGNGRSSVQAQVTGTALNGKAYITRLGSAGSRANVKKHDSEIGEDLEWGQSAAPASSKPSAAADLRNKLNLRLAKQHSGMTRNQEDNWDDFDAGFDSDGDDDRKQSTLKAGTITYQNVMNLKPVDQSQPSIQPGNAMGEADDMEDGFQLPLTLQHLKLIPRSPQSAVLRHRSSRSSLASAATGQTSDWDNIGTPANARASGTTSRTASSVIPGTDQSEVDDHHAGTRSGLDRDAEDDLEDGLELPVPSFFSNGRARELNKLLDRKRKPGVLSGPLPSIQTTHGSGTFRPTSTLMRPTLSSSAKLKYAPLAQDQLEDHLEDGLVLEDERTELTHGRLARIRQSRATTGTPTGPRNAAGGTLKRGFISGRQKVESASDIRPPSRSVSGSNGLLATPSNARIYQANHASPALPPASSANTPSRLRHRTSHSRLRDAPSSSSLGKRQSMSSIRDMAKLHEATGSSPYHPPIPNAPSYTAQTAASAARSAGNPRKSSTESDWPNMDRSRTPSERSYGVRSASSSMNSRTGRPRAPIPSSFTQQSISDESSSFAPSAFLSDNKLRKSAGFRTYGDGTELDGIEDLQVDRAKEGMVKLPKGTFSSAGGSLSRSAGQQLGLGRPPRSLQTLTATSEKRKDHPTEPIPPPRQAATSKAKPLARKAGLIRHLGRVEKKKVGDMVWNPDTLRWEGNYQVLRDFDAQVMSSARPALITHYGAFASMKATSSRSTVGSAVQDGKRVPSEVPASAPAAPLNAPRVVGNMMFDPEKMCWVSTLSAEDDEPDPFANIDEEDASDRQGSAGFGDQDEDFEDDGGHPLRGGTITKDMGKTMMDGIRSRGAGLMRFSSATTTSSLSSAGTSATSHDSENQRRRGDFPGFGRAEDVNEEDWDVDVGANMRKPQLRLSSVLTPGRSASNRSAVQTDSGFKVKSSGNPATSTTPTYPRYSQEHFRPSEHVSEALWRESIAAEARHEKEMLGWRVDEKIRRGWSARDVEKEREREKRREEKRLWEIRNLAMRS